eukprot:1947860-Amphidinium_carterae.1
MSQHLLNVQEEHLAVAFRRNEVNGDFHEHNASMQKKCASDYVTQLLQCKIQGRIIASHPDMSQT